MSERSPDGETAVCGWKSAPSYLSYTAGLRYSYAASRALPDGEVLGWARLRAFAIAYGRSPIPPRYVFTYRDVLSSFEMW